MACGPIEGSLAGKAGAGKAGAGKAGAGKADASSSRIVSFASKGSNKSDVPFTVPESVTS